MFAWLHDEEAVDAQYLQVPTPTCGRAVAHCLLTPSSTHWVSNAQANHIALSVIVSRFQQLGPILSIKDALTTAILWSPAWLRERTSPYSSQ